MGNCKSKNALPHAIDFCDHTHVQKSAFRYDKDSKQIFFIGDESTAILTGSSESLSSVEMTRVDSMNDEHFICEHRIEAKSERSLLEDIVEYLEDDDESTIQTYTTCSENSPVPLAASVKMIKTNPDALNAASIELKQFDDAVIDLCVSNTDIISPLALNHFDFDKVNSPNIKEEEDHASSKVDSHENSISDKVFVHESKVCEKYSDEYSRENNIFYCSSSDSADTDLNIYSKKVAFENLNSESICCTKEKCDAKELPRLEGRYDCDGQLDSLDYADAVSSLIQIGNLNRVNFEESKMGCTEMVKSITSYLATSSRATKNLDEQVVVEESYKDKDVVDSLDIVSFSSFDDVVSSLRQFDTDHDNNYANDEISFDERPNVQEAKPNENLNSTSLEQGEEESSFSKEYQDILREQYPCSGTNDFDEIMDTAIEASANLKLSENISAYCCEDTQDNIIEYEVFNTEETNVQDDAPREVPEEYICIEKNLDTEYSPKGYLDEDLFIKKEKIGHDSPSKEIARTPCTLDWMFQTDQSPSKEELDEDAKLEDNPRQDFLEGCQAECIVEMNEFITKKGPLCTELVESYDYRASDENLIRTTSYETEKKIRPLVVDFDLLDQEIGRSISSDSSPLVSPDWNSNDDDNIDTQRPNNTNVPPASNSIVEFSSSNLKSQTQQRISRSETSIDFSPKVRASSIPRLSINSPLRSTSPYKGTRPSKIPTPSRTPPCVGGCFADETNRSRGTNSIRDSSQTPTRRESRIPSPALKSNSTKKYIETPVSQCIASKPTTSASSAMSNLSEFTVESLPFDEAPMIKSSKSRRGLSKKSNCSEKWDPYLCLDKHGCERCLSMVSEKDRTMFFAIGRHQRVTKTRGGCHRLCDRYSGPRFYEDESVHMCLLCFNATHTQSTIRNLSSDYV